MNKYFLTGLFLFLLYGMQAKAENVYVPYLGLDGVYNKANGEGTRFQYFGANLNVGTLYNRYFGTEVFYEQTGSDSKKISETQKYKTSYRSYGLDLFGYLPLDCGSRFNLLGSVGFGEYVFHEKIKPFKHHNNSAYGYRFGLGALYQFDDHFAIKAMVRYVHFDHIHQIDHQMSYILGLRYHFLLKD